MRIAVIILVVTSMLACRNTRPVQITKPAVTFVDTINTVAIAEKVQPHLSATSEDAFRKVIKNYMDFSTFNAKVRVQYESKEGSDEATAFIRMKKDSAIWLSLRGALGIEGARVLITKDSINILNFLKKNVQNQSIDYLEKIADLPLDLHTLQNIIIGNPVFIDSAIATQDTIRNNEMVIQLVGKILKNIVTLNNADLTMVRSKIEDVQVPVKRTCEMTFNNYEKSSDKLFSTVRKISVAEKSTLIINLEFKQFAFEQPVTFPFSIPKSYKRV